METVLIQAQIRGEQTKGSNDRTRKSGFVPGVLYGKEMESISIVVPTKEMERLIAKKGENVLFKISLQKDGGSQDYDVILKEVQKHPYKGTLVHLDFYQVSMSEKISTIVAVNLVGDSVGAAKGGLVQQKLREVNILCLPGDIPDAIEVDITKLKIGGSITVADINVSDKVEITEEPNTVIANIAAPKVGGGATAEDDESEVAEEEVSATAEETEETSEATD